VPTLVLFTPLINVRLVPTRIGTALVADLCHLAISLTELACFGTEQDEATLGGRHEDNSSYLQEVRGNDTDEDSETDEDDTTERIPNNEGEDKDEDGTEVEDESEDEAEDENENELEAKDDDEEVMDDDEILNEEGFAEL
jgi:hypothetical protein